MSRRSRLLPWCALLPLAVSTACSEWLFSGRKQVDRSHPVALIETEAGVEYGAATEFGILCLGRTSKQGRCRVHYFLGDTPTIEDGELIAVGSTFVLARIDLRAQMVKMCDRHVGPDDELVVIHTTDGQSIVETPVTLAAGDGLAGDLLNDPSPLLPVGAGVFRYGEEGLEFCGLVSNRMTLQRGGAVTSYLSFAGLDCVREMLTVPERFPVDYEFRHRVDGVTVQQPIR